MAQPAIDLREPTPEPRRPARAPFVRKRPEPPPTTPLHALPFVAGAWIFFALAVAAYSVCALMLLPLLPLVVFGPVCLLSSAHSYANEARERRRAPVVRRKAR